MNTITIIEAPTPTATEIASSRRKAARLANILLVVPLGVISFSSTALDEITLSNGERTAYVKVEDHLIRVVTEIKNPDRSVRSRLDRSVEDIEAARALHRFFIA